ncbi:Tryptophan-associated transmembrane protein [Actinoalloteichus hymeniacidonis]|uniref:Tryptophan-associated transmembrane protein n=2 Tax=Actinoalloteichus hymeniacidonis TaxID=340345 RepID=A0AAC9HP21_9PSEU|nr:Tryptophan-associated transmembrane protein [Actinoalloteichus hymeniacidonis]
MKSSGPERSSGRGETAEPAADGTAEPLDAPGARRPAEVDSDGATDAVGGTDGAPASAAEGRRLLAILSGLLVLSAGLLWAGTLLPWLVLPSVVDGVPLVLLTGGDTAGWLVPLALLALAAIAALVSLGGLPRRIVGGVLVVAGAVVLWASIVGGDGEMSSELTSFSGSLIEQAVDEPPAILLGRVAAGAGGVLLAVVGCWTVLRGPVLPTMGSRYSRRRTERRPTDPQRRLWDTLDEGTDPTEGDR